MEKKLPLPTIKSLNLKKMLISGSLLEQAISPRWYGQIHTKLDVDTVLTEKEILSKNLLFVTMAMLVIY